MMTTEQTSVMATVLTAISGNVIDDGTHSAVVPPAASRTFR